MINSGIRINPAKQVELIKKAPYKAVLAITGGGTGVFKTLMHGGGASGILLDGIIPYSQRSLGEFLGGMTDKPCAENTARQMAMAAFQRALRLKDRDDKSQEIGVGLTCSLVKPGYDGEIREDGSHRKHIIHAAYQTRYVTYYEYLELRDYDRSRECEEDMAADMALQLLARACKVETNFVGTYHDAPGMARSIVGDNFGAEWRELPRVVIGDMPFIKSGQDSDVIFPGSFNLTTKNHKQISAAAAKFTGKPVLWEMAIVNADKPPIDYISLSKRMHALPKGSDDGYGGLILTRAPKFTDKAKLFPNTTFVVGADTWNRICDPRFYPSTNTYEGSVHEALDYIASCGVKFLIFQRKDITLSSDLPSFCSVIPLEEYKDDGNSSTAQRNAKRDDD